MKAIIVKGAKEHNLKNIDVTFKSHQLIIVTGLSGSGKSSLVMDTVYAEGQRRYVESLSSYARQFLGLMEKPEVDEIEGLSPAIAIDQKSTSKNPRSTVGTITEIYDYIRLLFARIGDVFCPRCHLPISKQSVSKIIEKIQEYSYGHRCHILAPIIQGVKGEHKEVFKKLRKEGYLRVRVDGEVRLLEDSIDLARYKIHHIEVVVDRIKIGSKDRDRLADSIETAVHLGKGLVIVQDEKKDHLYSENFACLGCEFSFKEISPRLFSFNSPYGACPDCDGLGTRSTNKSQYWLMRRYQKTHSEKVKEKIEQEMTSAICSTCEGRRLNPAALSVKLQNKDIVVLCEKSIEEVDFFFKNIQLKEQDLLIASKILKEIRVRLSFLVNVGLNYLSLSRSSATLSGGEAQRIRLATQIGSGLVDVLYVLDEPSIGLHQRDNDRLLKTLEDLRDSGNTLIVIEHDEETMKRADQIIDIGPGAGIHGGELVFSGSYKQILKDKKSLTGKYLSGKKYIPIPQQRRKGNGKNLEVLEAAHNNLKKINVTIPLGTLCAVTGVSGSGKSTLVNEIIHKGLAKKLYKSKDNPGTFKGFKGSENIDKVIVIDQSPIGRTPRSNPATYIGLFSFIRDLYAQLPESAARGYSPGRFSFNVKGGRCEACEGAGRIKIEMHFMPNVYVICDECKGKRFNRETQEVKLKGKSIANILEMTVEEALAIFENYPSIHNKLATLESVGLGYIGLGQSSVTLSGGEAQRIKLSRELSKRGTGKTLYILDEPTTGLHFADIEKLLSVLQRLVDKGNSILVIEHNLDVIKVCDHVIDLGPEGGAGGGSLVAEGTPEKVAKVKKSFTGQFLKKYLIRKSRNS
jgi:excinuclease ABC subunit A